MTDQLSHDLGIVPQAPSRRFEPRVRISKDSGSREWGRCHVHVHFSHMDDTQVKRVEEIVSALPEVLELVDQSAREDLHLTTRETLRCSADQIAALRTEAWDHERWHEVVLSELPCLTMADAEQRCQSTPWEPEQLLVLPHRGRRYIPAFQFLEDGSPSPIWFTLMAILLEQDRFDNWDLLAWLIRPHPAFEDRPPIDVLYADPKSVLRWARRLTDDGTL